MSKISRVPTFILATFVTVAHAQSPAGWPSVPGASVGVTAFVNVAVVPMDEERILRQQTVLVKEGWITALGPSAKVRVPASAVRIDGRGKYLIPGLADMHTHVTMSADSIESERRLFRWLAHGITTVRNMDYGIADDGERSLRLRARAAAGEILSPRIYTSGSWTKRPLRSFPPLDSVAAYVVAYKAAGYDFIKTHDEKREMFDSVLVVAHRLRIPVAGHVVNFAPLELGLAGMKSIEHLTGYGFSRKDADTAFGKPSYSAARAATTKHAGVWNCPTVAHFEVLSPATEVEQVRELIKALQGSGAGLLLGTDAGASLLGVPDMIWDQISTVHFELQALVRAGLTPYQALVTGTRNVAKYFGALGESGTVAVGKRADLVLLRGNPLTDIRNTTPPAGVMLSGRWLARAELDRRLAGPLKERKKYYQDYAASTYYGDFAIPFQGLRFESMDKAELTSLRALRRAQGVQLDSLINSLVVTDPQGPELEVAAGQQRVLDLVARHLGEIRAVLPSARQTALDVVARTWMQQYAGQGYRVAISGVTP